MQQIGLQRNFLWGADQGGAWQNPAAGSLWGLENQQREMGYNWQMYQFGYNRQMMETQDYFAGEQENLQSRRMGTTQAYQRWQSAFEYSGSLMQRGWTREDWAYQDSMRQMQFGWNMEDINEELRYAKGRDRKQLLKQRERMVTTENMEEGQIDKTRQRQEELWKREDERFQKQQDYMERMIKLDNEQYELQRRQRQTMFKMETEHLSKTEEQYQKEYELQTKIIELNREHQAKSLVLQEQALGIQAAAAQESEAFRKEMETVEKSWQDSTKEFELWKKYDPNAILKAMSELSINMSKIDRTTVFAVNNMVRGLYDLPLANPNAIVRLIDAINRVNTTKINQLISLMDDLSTP